MNSGNEKPAGHVPWELTQELKSLESGLSALTPREDRLDRERLIFLAGQASADATNQRPKSLLGLSLDATVWPRAFAAMTVVAATLFAMLLTRPSITNVLPATAVSKVASGSRPSQIRSHLIGKSRDMQADVFSAGDARRGDIERFLATRDELDAGTMTVDDRNRPALTPAAWRQVLGDAESLGLPTEESSNLLIDRGINS